MSRVRFEVQTPVTQSVKSVVELLNFLGKPSNPLPESVELKGAILVLSSKGDSYYVVTPKDCSCPSRTWRPGQQCKHQRRYFHRTNDTLARATAAEDAIAIKSITMAEVLEQANTNLKKMPKRYQAMVKAATDAAEDDPDSIMPKGKWDGGFNGPVEVD